MSLWKKKRKKERKKIIRIIVSIINRSNWKENITIIISIDKLICTRRGLSNAREELIRLMRRNTHRDYSLRKKRNRSRPIIPSVILFQGKYDRENTNFAKSCNISLRRHLIPDSISKLRDLFYNVISGAKMKICSFVTRWREPINR